MAVVVAVFIDDFDQILSHMGSTFFPNKHYLFKVNNRNFTKSCEICLKLIIKTPE